MQLVLHTERRGGEQRQGGDRHDGLQRQVLPLMRLLHAIRVRARHRPHEVPDQEGQEDRQEEGVEDQDLPVPVHTTPCQGDAGSYDVGDAIAERDVIRQRDEERVVIRTGCERLFEISTVWKFARSRKLGA